MAEISGNLKVSCDRVPEENQWSTEPTDGNWVVIVRYLQRMDTNQICRLGGELGLKYYNVEKMKTLPDDMVKAWLRKEDEVTQKCGDPLTWKVLVDALRRVGQNGIADEIQREKCVQSKSGSREATPKKGDSETTSSLSVSNTGGSSLETCTAVTQSSTRTQEAAGPKKSNDEQEKLLEVNKDKIRQSFVRLMREVLRILKGKDLDMDEFIMSVQSLFPPECIPDTDKISTIFRAITSHLLWSYSHYTPLKSIAEEFAKDDTQQFIESYEAELAGFYATTKLADYVGLCQDEDKVADPDVPLAPNPAKYDSKYYQKLTIKIGRRVTNETLKYIADIWRAVAKFFALPLLTALLDRVVAGSLVISWYIPNLCAMQIHINAKGGEAEVFYQAYQIIEVKIDNVCLYSNTAIDIKLALLSAIEEENIDQVLDLVGKLPDFDFSEYETTPLGAASKRHSPIVIIKILLQYPFDVNGRDKDGVTALMVASQEGNTDVMELLIKHNADVNARKEDGKTALMLASKEGRTDVVELLIQHNADVNARDEDGVTALILASAPGTIDFVKLDKSIKDILGLPSQTKVVELLIKHNADVNARSKDGRTALMAASLDGRTDVVELLIKHNADVNARAMIGWTALIAASFLGRTDVVEFLIKHNADVNARAMDSWTALMVASLNGKTDVVELLIKHNADVNARDEDGFTALTYATQKGNIGSVEVLLAAGANPNIAENETNWTPLFFASKDGHMEMVQLLVEHGADVDHKDKNGITAMDTARTYNHTEINDLFLAISMSKEFSVQSEEPTQTTTLDSPAVTQLSKETIKNLVHSAANHLYKKLVEKQKKPLMNFKNFLPGRGGKGIAGVYSAASGMGISEEDIMFSQNVF